MIILLHGDVETNPGPTNISTPNNTNYLSTYFLNARSLKALGSNKNKLQEFKELIHITQPCIMGVSETWLNKKISNSQIAPTTRYNIYRKDRPAKRGGGVLLMVDAKIRSDRKTDLELNTPNHNEILVVEIEPTHNTKFITIVAYRSQKDPPDIFMHNLESTLDRCTHANYNDFLLIGDFNFSKIKWDIRDLNLTGHSQNFIELTNRYGLTQLNTNPSTAHGNILDLILTNFPDKLTKIYASTFSYRSDHFLLDFAIRTKVDRLTPPNRTVLNLKRANHDQIYTDILDSRLAESFNEIDDVNDIWTNWKQRLLNIANKNIPKITVCNSDNPPWMDKALVQQLRRKNHALRRAKSLDTNEAWAKFKLLRNRLKNQISYKHRAYLFNLCESLHDNPKKFWTMLKSQTKSKSSPTKIIFNGYEGNTPTEIAKLLNCFFHSIFTPILPNLIPPPITIQVDPNLTTVILDEPDVIKHLKALNPTKAPGPDLVPTAVLKIHAEALAPSITKLFNTSLTQGKIPTLWKQANIIPIHKKGSPYQASNYRPISLLPTISKVLERCIYDKIIAHIIPKLANQQHGFLRNRSTTTQLLTIFSRINNILDKGKQADLIYFDLSKAFDSVPHKLLIHKLKGFGINGTLLAWITDYLTNRVQRVLIDGTHSEWLPVTSGVPQGSILGPLLFLLYINDLPDALSPDTICAIFADDTKIFRPITHKNDSIALQRDINNLHQWSKAWGLTFNSTKCTVLSVKRKYNVKIYQYTMNNLPLPRVDNMNDLGININNHIKWNQHVNTITNKANQRLWLIKRTLGFRTPIQAKLTAYQVMVRSILEYCTPLWNPCTKENLTRLELVQKKATNYILNNAPYDSPDHLNYKQRLIACNLLPTSYRREFYDISFFIKCLKGFAHFNITDYTNFIHDPLVRPTRNRAHGLNLTLPKTRLESTAHFYPSRIARLWNSLPLDLRDTIIKANSMYTVKKHLSQHYKNMLINTFDQTNICTWVTVCRCPMCRS